MCDAANQLLVACPRNSAPPPIAAARILDARARAHSSRSPGALASLLRKRTDRNETHETNVFLFCFLHNTVRPLPPPSECTWKCCVCFFFPTNTPTRSQAITRVKCLPKITLWAISICYHCYQARHIYKCSSKSKRNCITHVKKKRFDANLCLHPKENQKTHNRFSRRIILCPS